MKRFFQLLFAVVFCCCWGAGALAQETGADVDTAAPAKTANSAVSADTAQAQTQPKSECKLCRWFELQNASVSLRYRYVEDSTDVMAYHHGQQRTQVSGRFKFDAAGRYTINALASSGYYFNWAYAGISQRMDTDESIRRAVPGAATYFASENLKGALSNTVENIIKAQYANASPEVQAQVRAQLTTQLAPTVRQGLYNSYANNLRNVTLRSNGWNMFVRQLYFAAQPVDGIEVQYGSLPIFKGVSTEATSFDDDGYIAGGRVSIRRPKQLFFDEMAVTYAYFGDLFEPNFFRRTERLGQSNYHQFLVRKKFGKRVDVSTDYTFLDTTDTLREAIKLNIPEAKVIDWVRFEAYQRTSERTFSFTQFRKGNGFAVQAEKAVNKRLTLNGGYSSIDRYYTAYSPSTHYFGFVMNGDQTGIGNRVNGKVNYKLSKDLTMSMLLSQTVGNADANAGYYWNKTHFNVAFTYDLKNLFKQTGLF